MTPLTPEQVKEFSQDPSVFVFDCRAAPQFIISHVPKSIWMSLDNGFDTWPPFVVDSSQGDKVILITPPGREAEAVTRLAKLGITSVIGYLQGGFDGWEATGFEVKSTTMVDYSSVDQFSKNTAGYRIVDVRNQDEWKEGVLPNATLLTLSLVKSGTAQATEKNQKIVFHCRSGIRSLLATSIAERMGFSDVANLAGGMSKIKSTGVPTGPINQAPASHL